MSLRKIAILAFVSLAAIASAEENTAHPIVRQTMQAVTMTIGDDTTIYPVHARLNYTTIIIIPQGEKILDYLTGDKSAWVLEGAENFAYLRPAEAGKRTNVNLVTDKGNVYTFDVDEVSGHPDEVVDEKVILRPERHADLTSSSVSVAHANTPKFVSYETYERAKLTAETTAVAAQQTIERERQNVAQAMHFEYRYKQGKPFHVASVYNDGKFTYIQMSPDGDERPALYLIKDGKPDLTNYTFNDGVYIINGVVDHAYLRLGKAKLDIIRNADSK